MIYTTKYINAGSVEELEDNMSEWFSGTHIEPSFLINNIAYMQEMKVNRLNPQIPMVEFSCIITYSP